MYSFGLNNVLGLVKALSMIVHLMIMQLLYPPTVMLFYSGLFEYVNYDMIPTEEIYSEVFGWPNVAYSEEAELIGYESRYIIENSGSIPIYMLLIIVNQALFSLLKLCCKKISKRIHTYAHNKQEDFFWAGFNDFTNDVYLTMSFCAGINLSAYTFESAAISANNVFGAVIALVLALAPALYTISLSRAWNKHQEAANCERQTESDKKEDCEGGEPEEENKQSQG